MGGGFNVPVAKVEKVNPEENLRFWNPGLFGIKEAPEEFASKLKDIDPDLRVVWSNHHERWLLWVRKPALTSALNKGWSLLFVIKGSDGSYMPLDERTLARIYLTSASHWGNAKKYFDAIEREWERDRASAKAERDAEVQDGAGEYYDYMKIKNIGSGSKFADHWQ